MRWNKSSQPMVVERAVAGICYLTAGLAGLLYIILSGNSNQSLFFRFHFLQSIILGIILFLLGMTGNIMANILSGILGLFHSEQLSIVILTPVGWVLRILSGLIFLALAYGAIWAFLGKQAEIPGISRLVRQQMR